MKDKCFAERRDGECHALKEKKCKGCKFYTPRKEIYHNPFYAYSYETNYAHESDKRFHKIPDELVMNIED